MWRNLVGILLVPWRWRPQWQGLPLKNQVNTNHPHQCLHHTHLQTCPHLCPSDHCFWHHGSCRKRHQSRPHQRSSGPRWAPARNCPVTYLFQFGALRKPRKLCVHGDVFFTNLHVEDSVSIGIVITGIANSITVGIFLARVGHSETIILGK